MKRFDPYGLLESGLCRFCGASASGPSGICGTCRGKVAAEIEKAGGLCPRCSHPLVSTPPHCPFCGRIPEVLDAFVSCGYFHGVLKELVLALKKGDYGAATFLGELMYGSLRERGLEKLILVPVPPRKGKIRRQGWDQVDMLARGLKREWGMSVCACLKRTDRIQQKSLDYEHRLEHMSGCLVMRRGPVLPEAAKAVVVLDDVFTSGATMAAAAGILKSERKLKVVGAVLCSVV